MRDYPEPDDEEGFLYVREWEDQRLKEEFVFLLSLLHATAGELAFRADHPECRDSTALIPSTYTEMYELADELKLYAVQFPGAVTHDYTDRDD